MTEEPPATEETQPAIIPQELMPPLPDGQVLRRDRSLCTGNPEQSEEQAQDEE